MALKPAISVIIVAVMVSGVFFGCLGTSTAESAPEPSVPQFTVQIVSHPYYVPAVAPTYTTDPYTGEQKLVSSGTAGYTVENKTIEIRITNQQYTYTNGSTFTIYYDVRSKGHFQEQWTERYPKWTDIYSHEFVSDDAPTQSTSAVTIVSLPFNSVNYPSGGQIDFQVSAMVGHDSWAYAYTHLASFIPDSEIHTALVTQSDWSNIQTINLPTINVASSSPTTSPSTASTSTPSLTQTPTIMPTQSDNNTNANQPSWIEVVVVVALGLVAVLLVVVAVMGRRIRRLEQKLPP